MPILFVAPTVRILENWTLIRPHLLGILLIMVATTVLVFGISGRVTQLLLKKGAKEHD